MYNEDVTIIDSEISEWTISGCKNILLGYMGRKITFVHSALKPMHYLDSWIH